MWRKSIDGAAIRPIHLELFAVIADADDERLPPIARACLEGLARQFIGEPVGDCWTESEREPEIEDGRS